MKKEDQLLLALEFLTEGAKGARRVPLKLSRETFGTESFKRHTEKMRKKSRPWTQGPGIQCIGIGDKVTQGKPVPNQLALRVYVEKKKPKSKVKNPVPKQVAIPAVGTVTTDVLEIGRVEVESFTDRVRPAMPGCGVGHPDVKVGTLGCLVRKKGDKKTLYILSNSHVLADEGIAHIGDIILQPGRYDGGNPKQDVIARLHEFQPFDFGAGFPNLIYAAIAKVRSASAVTDVIRILGVKPVGVSKTLRRGMFVQKVGRTTDYTTGVIQDINVRLPITYKRPGHRSAYYRRQGHELRGRVGLREQVLCTRYTAGGDSGSVVLNRSKRVVGLHFAGSSSSSIFNRIEHVFSILQIEVA
jgi:hypothetical protein